MLEGKVDSSHENETKLLRPKNQDTASAEDKPDTAAGESSAERRQRERERQALHSSILPPYLEDIPMNSERLIRNSYHTNGSVEVQSEACMRLRYFSGLLAFLRSSSIDI